MYDVRYTLYENTTAALLFCSFLPLLLQCVPFAFISPYYFQFFSFSVIEVLNSRNKTPAQCIECVSEATHTKKMVLCIIYLLFVRRCIFKGRACVHVFVWLLFVQCQWFCCCYDFSMPLFTFGYVQRMLCPCAYYLNLFFFFCWRFCAHLDYLTTCTFALLWTIFISVFFGVSDSNLRLRKKEKKRAKK